MRRVVFALWFVLVGSSCATLSQSPKILNDIPVTARQAVIVVPYGTKIFQARLTAWERGDSGHWRQVLGPWPAVAGRRGFAQPGQKKEGDGHTPSGIFPLESAFGRARDLATGMEYVPSEAQDDVWVDDVNSVQYNQRVRGAVQAASFEQMLRSDGLYDLGIVIGYNRAPVVPGNGSAIFMHIWRPRGERPTAGCIALNQRDLRRLLGWLDRTSHPVVCLGAMDQ